MASATIGTTATKPYTYKLKCPKCGKDDIAKGNTTSICNSCGHKWVNNPKADMKPILTGEMTESAILKSPQILMTINQQLSMPSFEQRLGNKLNKVITAPMLLTEQPIKKKIITEQRGLIGLLLKAFVTWMRENGVSKEELRADDKLYDRFIKIRNAVRTYENAIKEIYEISKELLADDEKAQAEMKKVLEITLKNGVKIIKAAMVDIANEIKKRHEGTEEPKPEETKTAADTKDEFAKGMEAPARTSPSANPHAAVEWRNRNIRTI
jgi:uncharacterized protein (DUF983 family)